MSGFEDILAEVVSSYISENLFGKFSLNKFKTLPTPEARFDYLNTSALPYMGSGAAKDVFAVSSGKVLKMSRYGNGGDEVQSQLKREIERSLKFGNSGIVPRLYDYDKNEFSWMLVEPIKQFDSPGDDDNMKAITGVSVAMLGNFDVMLTEWILEAEKAKSAEEIIRYVALLKDAVWMAPRAKKLLEAYHNNPKAKELLEKYFTMAIRHGVSDIDRADHWGMDADGSIKVLDFGM